MSNDPIPELMALLREPVVFIDWPRGVKGSQRKWRHLTTDHMTPGYLSKLKEGNIGVALGEASGGLCAIDIDDDKFVEPFRWSNPGLETLQTHGARGSVFWVRFKGSYPQRTVKLKTESGEDVGEFRSTGSQSIIWGIHPDTQRPYEFILKEPVVEVGFNSIKWPDQIKKYPQCTEEDASHSVSSVSSVSSVPSVSSVSSVSSVHGWTFRVRTLEDLLRCSKPSKRKVNNKLLFFFARGVKALEAQGGEFTGEQLRNVFDQWHSRATKFLRPGQTKEGYFVEFLNAYRGAKFPLGGKAPTQAWKLAQEQPLPSEAGQFENPKLRLLVAFCRQLQILNGSEPFFLSCRVCQGLLEQESHTTAAKWLQALCAMRIIKEIEKGKNLRASRYRYLCP